MYHFFPPYDKNEPLLGSKPDHFPFLSSSLFNVVNHPLIHHFSDPQLTSRAWQCLTIFFQYFTAHIYEFQFYKTLCEVSGQYVPGDKDKPLHRCNFYGITFFLLFTIAFTVSFLKIFLLLNFFLNPQSHLVHCWGERSLTRDETLYRPHC